MVQIISLKSQPLFINNQPLPVYGCYTRDWLFVKDYAEAIDLVFHKGLNYEMYNYR